MKVALLFYGQARFINNPFVYSSFKDHIIDKYDTDVFCHTWWSEDMIHYEPSPRCCDGEIYDIDKNLLETIRDKYNPKVLQYDKNIDFNIFPLCKKYIDGMMNHEKWGKDGFKWDPIEGRKEKNFMNLISCGFSMEKVSSIFEKYCYDNNLTYDFIILSRYDNYIKSFPDLKSLSNEYFYVSNVHRYWPDLMFISGVKYSKAFKVFSYLMNQMENNSLTFFNSLDRNMAEHVKELCFLYYYNKECIRPIEFYSSIVRNTYCKGDKLGI